MELTCNNCKETKDCQKFVKCPKMNTGYKNECIECRKFRERKAERKKQGIVQKKVCASCEIEKDSASFNMDKSMPDGLTCICMSCAKDKVKVLEAKNKMFCTCTKCKEHKSGEKFPVSKQTYTGLYPVCKDCLSKHRSENGIYRLMSGQIKLKKKTIPGFHEAFNLYGKERWNRLDPRQKMWKQSSNRARNRTGFEHTITIDDIIVPDVCPILKIPFEIGTKGDYEHTPSLDRIDNNYGYIPGNIQVITKKANSMKNSGTPEELLLLADWVYETFGHLRNLKTA